MLHDLVRPRKKCLKSMVFCQVPTKNRPPLREFSFIHTPRQMSEQELIVALSTIIQRPVEECQPILERAGWNLEVFFEFKIKTYMN